MVMQDSIENDSPKNNTQNNHRKPGKEEDTGASPKKRVSRFRLQEEEREAEIAENTDENADTNVNATETDPLKPTRKGFLSFVNWRSIVETKHADIEAPQSNSEHDSSP